MKTSVRMAGSILLGLLPQREPIRGDSLADEALPVPVRFEGWLPGSADPRLEGEFRVDFALYRSPQGGEPVWHENQRVVVHRGRMNVLLGLENEIPLELHDETFKFLGASVNGAPEVYPRFTVVNVVLATAEAALVPSPGGPEKAMQPYGRERRRVSNTTQSPTTWSEALRLARAAGGDLPDYEDWYASLGDLEPEALLERTGHYEWVLPWVYDPTSHPRYQALFRGRFQGCDYMDLSPRKTYAYRLSFPHVGEGGGASER